MRGLVKSQLGKQVHARVSVAKISRRRTIRGSGDFGNDALLFSPHQPPPPPPSSRFARLPPTTVPSSAININNILYQYGPAVLEAVRTRVVSNVNVDGAST